MSVLLQLVGLAPEHRDVITTGGQVVLAVLGIISVQLEANRRQGKKTREASELAAKRSAPTGNGYAARTSAALERIERDLGGMREDLRGTNDRVDHIGRRLDSHLDG